MLKIKTLLIVLLTAFIVKVQAQTTVIKGLTVVVEFTDAPFKNSLDSVSKMMNQPGFVGWGNEGSVRDYFLVQTAGKLDISSTVIKVSMPNTVDYYFNNNPMQLSDIIDKINQTYPNGFQDLTLNPDGGIKHFHILCKADKGAWAFGEQAGSKHIKNNNVLTPVLTGNLSTYGRNQDPEYNVICHEMGHNVMKWPDYYATAWSNLGNYCVMASAGTNKGPMPVSPALRLKNNWIDNVIEIGATTQTYTATSNSYTTVYKYVNPYNPKEYLLIHPQVYGGYYQQYPGTQNVPDQGLAIYYVDQDGGMDLAGDEFDHLVHLVQADNRDDLHDEDKKHINVRGDLTDLFDNQTSSFNSSTSIFKWKDGGEFGISLSNISAPGATMSFTVNVLASKFIVTSDKNGTVSPSGVIQAAAGASKTFTFSPFPGYEIDQVKVNGVVTTVTGNTYTTTGSGTKTIAVTYKRKVVLDQLPSPWNHSDIGTPSVAGVSGQQNGKFYVESYGTDVYGSSDNFRFVYQPLIGDGSIEAKMTFANKPQRWSKAGLMIRESLNANSAYSFLMYTPRNNTRVQQRTSTNGSASDNPDNKGDLHFYNLYKWFKIKREGNTIYSYCSRDRSNWVLMAEETINMGAAVYVGFAVTGALPNYPARAQFDSVTVVKSQVVGCADPAWSATATYTNGSKVSYNGRKYTAKWWTQNNRPDQNSGAGQVWTDNGVCASENLIPVITLTGPASATKFRLPANVTITADASDTDGTVDRVEFYQGTTLLGSDNTAPYSFTWTNAPEGSYVITAKVFDNQGATATSSAAYILVANNIAPIITIDSPIPVNGVNPKYLVGGSKDLYVYASDDNEVEKLVFTLPKTGETITDFTPPYQVTFSNLPAPYADGSLYFTVTAYDFEGASSTENIFIYKNKVPTVTITAPASNANFATGSNVTLSALVTDPDWTAGKVEYFNGSTKIGETTTNTVGSSPVSFVWNNVANGTYTITAKATDDMTENATSAAVTFTVTTPTSTCTAPVWSASASYNGNAVVQYNGIKYKANWWTQGDRPDLNSGAVGTGKPWTSQGVCNAREDGEELQLAPSVTVYPNPSTGTFTIETTNTATAEILSAYGNQVASLKLEEGKNEVSLAVPAGVYVVKINNHISKLVIE